MIDEAENEAGMRVEHGTATRIAARLRATITRLAPDGTSGPRSQRRSRIAQPPIATNRHHEQPRLPERANPLHMSETFRPPVRSPRLASNRLGVKSFNEAGRTKNALVGDAGSFQNSGPRNKTNLDTPHRSQATMHTTHLELPYILPSQRHCDGLIFACSFPSPRAA